MDELQHSEAPEREVLPSKPVRTIDKGIDIREGGEWRDLASQMEVTDSMGGLSAADAAKLARAIEDAHGERTASTRERDGAFRVWRTEPRPLRTSAAKKAAVAPAKKAKAGKEIK